MTEAGRDVGDAIPGEFGPLPTRSLAAWHARDLARTHTPCIGGDDRVEYGRSGTIVKIVA